MDDQCLEAKLRSAIIGRRCTNVSHRATESWELLFDDDTRVYVQCPWRILANGRIALGNCDHNQSFGRIESVDGQKEARRLLDGEVSDLSIRAQTSDQVLVFSKGARLELFHRSSGYEGWECLTKGGLNVIALGGGEIAFFE